MAWNSPPLTRPTVFPPTPTSLTPSPRVKIGTRRSFCSIRAIWPMSRIIGFHLDHDQTISLLRRRVLSFQRVARGRHAASMWTSFTARGLRTDADGPGRFQHSQRRAPCRPIIEINLGAEQSFKLARKQSLKVRLDVVNVTDNVYELRNGSGVGVNAAQYGMRRGFFGSLSYNSEAGGPPAGRKMNTINRNCGRGRLSVKI